MPKGTTGITSTSLTPPAGPVPREALDFFEAKGLRPRLDYQEVWKEEHDYAFTVAKVVEQDILQEIQNSLAEALRQGTPFEEWAKDIRGEFDRSGWSDYNRGREPSRLRLIFETNMRTARAAGQWQRIEKTKDILPFLKYELGPSQEHREEHVAWAEAPTILAVDDPWWETHMPPNGWGCKCWVRQITSREAEALGGETEAPPEELVSWTNPETGAVEAIPVGIDPGWDHNPGQERSDLVASIPEKVRIKFQEMIDAGLINGTIEAHVGLAQATLEQHKLGAEALLKKLGETALPDNGIVQLRVKDLESAVEKIERKPKYGDVRGAGDNTGGRIIVDNIDQVYSTVERVKENFNVWGEIEDKIANPQGAEKYRSVHIIVIDEDGLAKELQIRTKNEHEMAEWTHDIYKPHSEEQKAYYAAHEAELKELAARFSDYYYKVDTGQAPGTKPEVPEDVMALFGEPGNRARKDDKPEPTPVEPGAVDEWIKSQKSEPTPPESGPAPEAPPPPEPAKPEPPPDRPKLGADVPEEYWQHPTAPKVEDASKSVDQIGQLSIHMMLAKDSGGITAEQQVELRQALNNLLASEGMVSKDILAAVKIGDKGGEIVIDNVATAREGAPAFHDWDGKIYIETSIADNAAGVYLNPDGTLNGKESGLHVLIHEAVHGHSPMTAGVYQVPAVKVLEESTTEAAAQKILDEFRKEGKFIGGDRFLMDVDGWTSYGVGYGAYIYDMNTAIAERLGISKQEALREFTRAAIEMRQSDDRFPQSDLYFQHFMAQFPKWGDAMDRAEKAAADFFDKQLERAKSGEDPVFTATFLRNRFLKSFDDPDAERVLQRDRAHAIEHARSEEVKADREYLKSMAAQSFQDRKVR